MKKLLYICTSLILSASIFFNTTFAYSLTDTDFNILDSMEEKLRDLMDEHEMTVEFVVGVITSYTSSTTLDDRQTALLEQLIDDVQYFGNFETGGGWYMLEEDCYEDEVYSKEDERCYPLSESLESYDTSDNYSGADTDTELTSTGIYTITADDNLQSSQDIDVRSQAIRKLFTSLIPVQARSDITQVEFADDSNNDTYAYVQQLDNDVTKWKVVFNLGLLYGTDGQIDMKETQHTMIHEFVHVLTLNTTQLQPLAADASDEAWERANNLCDTYFLSEGCLRDGAYMKEFIDKFWDQSELDTARDQEQPDIYTAEEYVTDYASTNPGEDIAESFTHFVLQSKPVGNSEAEQKISFFYEFPDLLKLRSSIRAKLVK